MTDSQNSAEELLFMVTETTNVQEDAITETTNGQGSLFSDGKGGEVKLAPVPLEVVEYFPPPCDCRFELLTSIGGEYTLIRILRAREMEAGGGKIMIIFDIKHIELIKISSMVNNSKIYEVYGGKITSTLDIKLGEINSAVSSKIYEELRGISKSRWITEATSESKISFYVGKGKEVKLVSVPAVFVEGFPQPSTDCEHTVLYASIDGKKSSIFIFDKHEMEICGKNIIIFDATTVEIESKNTTKIVEELFNVGAPDYQKYLVMLPPN